MPAASASMRCSGMPLNTALWTTCDLNHIIGDTSVSFGSIRLVYKPGNGRV